MLVFGFGLRCWVLVLIVQVVCFCLKLEIILGFVMMMFVLLWFADFDCLVLIYELLIKLFDTLLIACLFCSRVAELLAVCDVLLYLLFYGLLLGLIAV